MNVKSTSRRTIERDDSVGSGPWLEHLLVWIGAPYLLMVVSQIYSGDTQHVTPLALCTYAFTVILLWARAMHVADASGAARWQGMIKRVRQEEGATRTTVQIAMPHFNLRTVFFLTGFIAVACGSYRWLGGWRSAQAIAYTCGLVTHLIVLGAAAIAVVLHSRRAEQFRQPLRPVRAAILGSTIGCFISSTLLSLLFSAILAFEMRAPFSALLFGALMGAVIMGLCASVGMIPISGPVGSLVVHWRSLSREVAVEVDARPSPPEFLKTLVVSPKGPVEKQPSASDS